MNNIIPNIFIFVIKKFKILGLILHHPYFQIYINFQPLKNNNLLIKCSSKIFKSNLNNMDF